MANHPSVPPGPARVRASDADRERVAAAIREHWHAGRLDQGELEYRLGRVFAARTLGDLRALMADLPAPVQAPRVDTGRTVGYLGRALLGGMKRVLVTGAAVLVVLMVIGFIAGDDDEEEPAGPNGPSANRQGPPPATPDLTRVAKGETGTDDDVAFQVLRVRSAKTVPLRSDRGGGELAPGEGRKYLVAEVAFTNRGGRPVDPYCGSGGAQLLSRDGRVHELINDLYKVEGNQAMCSGGLADGASARVQLVFSVPPSARARGLEIWNADAREDILGRYSRLRFRV